MMNDASATPASPLAVVRGWLALNDGRPMHWR
jgi:hypothetical protein